MPLLAPEMQTILSLRDSIESFGSLPRIGFFQDNLSREDNQEAGRVKMYFIAISEVYVQ